MFRQLVQWASFVKFSHTLFALPFALASMMVAARENSGWPGLRIFVLVVAAMVTARTCAMSFNRIVDRRFDALNPRTSGRHLPAGQISLASAWALCILSGALFILCAALLNRPCFYLSPLALFIILFYSFTKRFTDFTHFYLGLALALAPLGAWLAVRGSISFTPLLLAIIVFCWLIGFDVIYALQDYDFDRKQKLHSLVVRWGPANALQFAFLVHMVMWGLLLLFGLICRFRVAFFTSLLIILLSLLLEHWLARRRSLRWIDTAFFRLNVLISLVFLLGTAIEIIFPGFRIRR